MAEISVLLPVAATSDPEELYRAYESIVNQTTSPSEILLITNQRLSNKIETVIYDLTRTQSETRHEHFIDAKGLGGVLQAGLEECSKPFVARMDADDVSEPDRFNNQLKLLTRTDVDIVGSHLAEFRVDPDNPERVRTVPTSHEKIVEWMPWRCPLNHPTTMFKRKPVLEAGGYRDFPMMEDWDLWARCLAAGLQFDNIDQVLVRAQTDNLTDRRGGLNYARAEIQMAQELRELGIASPIDTLRHLCFRTPLRLLPLLLREKIYHITSRSSIDIKRP